MNAWVLRYGLMSLVSGMCAAAALTQTGKDALVVFVGMMAAAAWNAWFAGSSWEDGEGQP